MKCILHHFLVFFYSILFISCGTNPPPEVIQALELAGENQEELQRVLDHYKQDTRKLQAAYFLIANMRYHKSKQKIQVSDQLERYLTRTDSLYHALFDGMDSEEVLLSKPKKQDEIRRELADDYRLIPSPLVAENDLNDLEVISAEFLIEHIDWAFGQWQTGPLLKNLSFDDFKEFVLPYRSTNEELSFSSRQLHQIWSDILSQESLDNITYPLARYKAYVNKIRWINHFTKPTEKAAMYDLFLPKFQMDCHNMTNWSIRVLRACGIPVVYEYTPQWKDRDSRHFWCVSPDSTGVWQPYTAPDNNLREDWESDIRYAGKVYRRTFSANKRTPYFLADEFEYIPEELSSPLLSDQTYRYHQTVTLRLPLNIELDNNLVYLCLFKGEDLNPVGWGTVEKESHELIFEQVPLNTVFVPVYYNEKEEAVPLSEPFLIQYPGVCPDIPEPLTTNRPSRVKTLSLTEKGLMEKGFLRNKLSDLRYVSFASGQEVLNDMIVTRKYPEKRRLKKMRDQLIGAFFTGSMEEKRGYDTLYTLDAAPVPYLQEVSLNNEKAYRYYRFWTADGAPVNIAHMEFLGHKEDSGVGSPPTQLPVFSPSQPHTSNIRDFTKIEGRPLPTGSNPHYAFDGDPTTYVGSSGIGIDFGREVTISHVRFLPRTANNGIIPGNEYKLMYHNGKEWIAHASQIAEENYILFEDVPSGTLYWLRNTTEGKEELPFLFQDGKQLFIHVAEP